LSEPFYRYPLAGDPATCELENRIVAPEQKIEAHMESLAPMAGRVVVDVGAGGGFHAARYSVRAARVYAAEPDPDMRRLNHARRTPAR
jgi:protein-L-isoaspartate O-methyltransferase